MIKFKDIKTKEDLKTRVVNGVLNTGNQYKHIKNLLDYENDGNMLEVNVVLSIYNDINGIKILRRYI